MTLPRSAELQWQQEIIELWLNTTGLPADARTGLLEMLRTVKEEKENLCVEIHPDGLNKAKGGIENHAPAGQFGVSPQSVRAAAVRQLPRS